MAGNMFEALKNAGALSKDVLEREEGLRSFREEDETEEEAMRRAKGANASITKADLLGKATINGFRQAAKELLLADRITMKDVIDAVHRLRDGLTSTGDEPSPELKRLVALMYNVRDSLQGAMAAQRVQIIKQAFRRAGSKFQDR